jgi:hypothetical protein
MTSRGTPCSGPRTCLLTFALAAAASRARTANGIGVDVDILIDSEIGDSVAASKPMVAHATVTAGREMWLRIKT